jgi:hypothetical protein
VESEIVKVMVFGIFDATLHFGSCEMVNSSGFFVRLMISFFVIVFFVRLIFLANF